MRLPAAGNGPIPSVLVSCACPLRLKSGAIQDDLPLVDFRGGTRDQGKRIFTVWRPHILHLPRPVPEKLRKTRSPGTRFRCSLRPPGVAGGRAGVKLQSAAGKWEGYKKHFPYGV